MMKINFLVSQLFIPFYGAIRRIFRHIFKILWIRLYGSFSNPEFKLKQSPNSFYNKPNRLYCKLLCLRYCVAKSCLNPIKSYRNDGNN